MRIGWSRAAYGGNQRRQRGGWSDQICLHARQLVQPTNRIASLSLHVPSRTASQAAV